MSWKLSIAPQCGCPAVNLALGRACVRSGFPGFAQAKSLESPKRKSAAPPCPDGVVVLLVSPSPGPGPTVDRDRPDDPGRHHQRSAPSSLIHGRTCVAASKHKATARPRHPGLGDRVGPVGRGAGRLAELQQFAITCISFALCVTISATFIDGMSPKVFRAGLSGAGRSPAACAKASRDCGRRRAR